MFKLCIVVLFSLIFFRKSDQAMQEEIKKLVEHWSSELGEELHRLSLTMTRKKKVTESFRPLKDKIYYGDGNELIENVAAEMKIIMYKKMEAVTRIAEYAEFLAYHRKTDHLEPNGTFRFYDAENITKTTRHWSKEEDLREEIQEAECDWWCHQKDLTPLPNMFSSSFTSNLIESLFASKSVTDGGKMQCDCENPPDRTRPVEHFNWLPMKDDPHYGTKVNLNLSVVKINTNIYHRDQDVLQGIRWSEALDLIFRQNLEKDPTLKFQYFASPYGFMRHFPALQWSEESYDVTYDPRTRSWYTEAMTSPKDIIILLDRSGSMEGRKRKLSAHIVNNILDTLNDNDFVNIYTFTNSTEPLVSCFADTLVQANEENLRLLRESLSVYRIEFAADISLGFEKAFELLADFRQKNASSRCNQAIMLITEGIDYDYKPQQFNYSNWQYGTPVRIFTYELERDDRDSKVLEWIACSNRGYFVNVSLLEEVREKTLQYMNVMSRPVNHMFMKKQTPIWSYLYIDLADRRYSNWLWRKFEGNRQRAIFLDHAKREFMRLQRVLTSEKHLLLQETHDYEKYQTSHNFDYMTTVSLPVYGRRPEDIDLIGVAAVDIPIKLLNSLIPHHKLGVNGYAFILTNNGYVLMHPRHRREFENIPKPTFNRVDFLEVEILDDLTEPRLFDKSIVELREKIVEREKGHGVLKVKFTLDDMKRIILSKRRYYYTAIGPFRLAIALPDKYGLMLVKKSNVTYKYARGLTATHNWTVHPDWIYCQDSSGKKPEQVVLDCIRCKRSGRPLLTSLIFDANATMWFEEKIEGEENFVKKHLVDNVFIATHSGLTRWKTFENHINMEDDDEDKKTKETFRGNRAIDEDWYRRTVEENFNKNENMFIYSVPFEISGFENNTMITSTNAIFVEAEGKKTPIAVVGLQFNHRAMYNLYRAITTECPNRQSTGSCRYTCESDFLTCFILDNNAYVVLSDDVEYTGRFLGDIKPGIMYHLVNNGVYKATRMFDYQAICQKLPLKQNAAGSTISFFRKFFENLLHVTDWALATILLLVTSVVGGPDYQSLKNDTLAYENLEINKTFPTPCDQEMWLFTLGDNFKETVYLNKTSKFECTWPYVVKRIPHSNLIFMAINPLCELDTTNTYDKTPTPTEIIYNDTLPCYIAIHNNFSRRIYMNCYNRSMAEDELNKKDRFYCGHTWM